MYALKIKSDGRIEWATEPKFAPKNGVLVDSLPEGNIVEYRYVDGKFVHDPQPEVEQEEPVPLVARVEVLESETADLNEALELLLSGVTE